MDFFSLKWKNEKREADAVMSIRREAFIVMQSGFFLSCTKYPTTLPSNIKG